MFQTKRYQAIFADHQLDGFIPLWNKKIDWFEEPNQRRGGWSGVGQLTLNTNDDELCVFVKKQQNHGRRTVLHPFKGEPTFRREFKRLEFLRTRGIPAPKVVFYGEQAIESESCAVLVTEALLGYQPLEDVTRDWFASKSHTRQQKRALLKTVAIALRRFHDTGLVHRSLYPKHIFVKEAEQQPEVALIDLEKARFSPFFLYRAYFDLSALNRHAEHWSRTDRVYFLLNYLQVQKLSKLLKVLRFLILRRSAR